MTIQNAKTTLLIRNGDRHFRLAKIFFGSDGSYYSTLPLHRSKKAVLMKLTVDYDAGTTVVVGGEDVLDTGLVEDESIKVTHHPNGFVQFSGKGVFSGKDPDGNIRGMGVMSSPLLDIFDGPSLSYHVTDINDLETVNGVRSSDLVLDLDDYIPIHQTNAVTVEAYYFTPMMRRFIRLDHRRRPLMRLNHPCGKVLDLELFLAPQGCDIPGFLGFDLYRADLNLSGNGYALGATLPENGYAFGAPAGSVRFGKDGHKLADAIFCVYPKPDDLDVDRSLNFPLRPI